MDQTPSRRDDRRNFSGLGDEHLRALGSIVAALGHLDLLLITTVRDLVPGADGTSVEALLAGDSTPQLAAKLDRLTKQHHGDEPICAQVVDWCVSLNGVWERWNQELHSSWLGGQPNDSLRRVRYTKTAYFGGLPMEQTRIDYLYGIEDDMADRIEELEAMRPRLTVSP